MFQVATNGTATVSLSGYIATATYTANTNYIGQDSFSYYFCNTLLLCDTATIYVTILPNNAPVAMNDTVQTNQNTALIIPFLLNDSDDQTINTTNNTVSVLINGMHGTASSNGLNMSYVPNTNYFGLDSFSYTLCDAGLLCDTAWVFVSINPVFTATASFTNPDSCSNSCTNTITISASNGVPPYLYSINNGATYVSSPIFTNKCSGLKYIKVKDALNNIFSLSLMVTSNYISSYIFGYQAPCANNSSGTSSYIGINASGGSGQYSYLWNNGVDSNYLLSPANGLNTVLITDLVTGCTFSKSTQINNVYCSKINGNIILDFNTNCFQDTNDIPITQQYIAFQDSITNQTYYGITNSAGFYSISLPHGVYRLVIPPTLANIYTITCPSLPTYISVDSTNFIDTLNIYLTPIAYNDLNVMYTLYTIRPGFTFDNLIRYRNVGTAATNATIVLQYNPLLEPSSSNTGIIDTANHTITWTITNLAINPNYSHIYPIFLPLNSTVPLGTYICNTATISPIVGDSTPTYNVSTHCQTVVGSSDPNEKSVYPNGAIDTAIKRIDII